MPTKPKRKLQRKGPHPDGPNYDVNNPLVIDQIHREIMRDMTSCKWVTGPSHHAYAEKYRVSTDTVKGWATTASRMLRMLQGDPEETRSRLLAGVEHAAFVSMRGRKPDVKAYLDAVRTHSKIAGLIQAQGTNLEAPKQEDVSIEDVITLLREAGYQVTKP